MPMSWKTQMEFEPPLADERFANLECKVIDTRMVARYGFFVPDVVKAWIDPARKEPRTLHHMGRGRFMVAGETIRLPPANAWAGAARRVAGRRRGSDRSNGLRGTHPFS